VVGDASTFLRFWHQINLTDYSLVVGRNLLGTAPFVLIHTVVGSCTGYCAPHFHPAQEVSRISTKKKEKKSESRNAKKYEVDKYDE
jgi:hypothetical protein